MSSNLRECNPFVTLVVDSGESRTIVSKFMTQARSIRITTGGAPDHFLITSIRIGGREQFANTEVGAAALMFTGSQFFQRLDDAMPNAEVEITCKNIHTESSVLKVALSYTKPRQLVI